MTRSSDFLSNKKTKVDLKNQSLMIHSVANEEEYVKYFEKYNFSLFIWLSVILCILIIGWISFNGLFTLTMQCERTQAGGEVVCHVSKDHLLKENEMVIDNQPVDNAYMDDSDDTCSFVFEMADGREVKPLGSMSASAYCIDSFDEEIGSLFYDSNIVDKKSVAVGDWLLFPLFIILATVFMWFVLFYLPKKHFFLKVVFDAKYRNVTYYYYTIRRRNDETFAFDTIKSVTMHEKKYDGALFYNITMLSKDGKKYLIETQSRQHETEVLLNDIQQIIK